MTSVQIGQRVVRSNTWTWSNQDGGEGHVGTVIRLGSNNLPTGMGTPAGWVKIRWDNGFGNNYQVGSKNFYDLALLDNAPAGVTHMGIICDGCGENPIAGMRWRCSNENCHDVDLCTACYMNDKHDVTHIFTRFSTGSETGVQVSSRFGQVKVVSKGLFPGATVTRGKDLHSGGHDGEGTITEVIELSERPRSGVTVRWSQTGVTGRHRVGCDGKVELKYVEPGVGFDYYSQFLPILGKEDGLRVGDHVAVTLDRETLEVVQRAGGLQWTQQMGAVFGKVAKVTDITLGGDVDVSYSNGNKFTFHPQVLSKIPKLGKGDRVQVNKDLSYVMNLQENSQNGWMDGMEKCLGMEGDVTKVDSNKNVRVQLIGIDKVLSWHPCTLMLLKKNSTSEDDASGIESDGDVLQALKSLLQGALDLSDDSSDPGDEDKELGKAAKSGNVERVVEILSKSPEKVNTKVNGRSPLHHASAMGHMQVVQALLEAGADLGIRDDKSKSTPLHYAVEGDEPAIVKYLIGRGADANIGNKNGRRGLNVAAWKGHVDCARILIKLGCDVNLQDSDGDTPLHDAIYKKSTEVIELILEAPDVDLTLANKRELTPLQFTAFLDRPSAAEMIVQAYPKSIIIPRQDGHTVLHIAAVNDHAEVMKVILAVQDNGLCLDSMNDIGLTALHLAVTKGQTESAEFLVTNGADINCQGRDDNTALHLLAMAKAKDASKVNDSPTMQKIRQRYKQFGCDDSASALMCFMVMRGASVTVENQQCRTPLSYVTSMKLKKTLKEIARGDNDDTLDMSSWEDLGEDEDVKSGRLSGDAVDEDNDIIANRNERRGANEVKAGAGGGTGTNTTGSSAPGSSVGVFDLVHQIEVSELKMGPVIGQGQYGVVHRASWRGTPVAVKKIAILGSKQSDVEKEVAIHRRASHPNIVQMMALGYDGSRDAYIVMQLIDGTSLNDIIYRDRDVGKLKLSRQQKLEISRAILQAVTYMHACSILHLDIKPANILIETLTTRPYICDLGLAHIKNRNLMSQSSVNMRGTPCYMPPEALGPPRTDKRHSDKHDVWSVAGTLVELFSEKRLWGDAMNPLALLAQMMIGAMGRPKSLAAVEQGARKILDPCFNQDPATRPSAHKLLDQFNALT